MFERLARWIFDFRSQILGVLSALTLWTAFTAARVTLEAAHPEPPPSDPAIRAAARVYETAFPQMQRLAVLVTARDGARLDLPAGLDLLNAVDGLIGNLPSPPATGQDPTHVVHAPQLFRRVAPDNASAVIEAALPAAVPLDVTAFKAALAALSTAPESDRRFEAKLLMPEPPAGFLVHWAATVGPLVVGAALLAAGLLAYSGSFVLTGMIVGAALLAIIWQVGLWATFGGSVQPSLRFIPGLIFVLTLGHGFQMARHVMRALAAGASALEATMGMVRRLAPAGGPALICVALALAAAAIAPVPSARATLAFSALGVVMVLPALYIVMPALLSMMQIDRPPHMPAPEPAAAKPRRARPELSLRQAAAGPQIIVILALALALIAALEGQGRRFGPIDSAELGRSTSASWLAAADDAARGVGNPLASLSVVARVKPQACLDFDVLDAVDRLSWRLANLPGVARVESLPVALRGLQADAHGGDPRWRDVPRTRAGVLQALVKIPESAALLDGRCRTLALRVYMAPPFARALTEVDQAVARFRAENTTRAVTFELGGGPMARALSEQRTLARYQVGIVLAMLTALVGTVFFGLKDWRGATTMSVMGLALFLAAGWAINAIPIGLTGGTAPSILFAMLLPADMAVYVLVSWRSPGGAGDTDPLRRRLWQRDGQALLARALAVSLGFSVWLTASDPMERSLAILAIATGLAGTVTALFVIPAVSMLIERGLIRRSAVADEGA